MSITNAQQALNDLDRCLTRVETSLDQMITGVAQVNEPWTFLENELGSLSVAFADTAFYAQTYGTEMQSTLTHRGKVLANVLGTEADDLRDHIEAFVDEMITLHDAGTWPKTKIVVQTATHKDIIITRRKARCSDMPSSISTLAVALRDACAAAKGTES